MKILVLTNPKDDLIHRSKLIQEDYPDSEQVMVESQESLVVALQEENPDLVISGYTIHWIDRPELMRIVQSNRPGLPIILVREVSPADPIEPLVAFPPDYRSIDSLLNTPSDTIVLFDADRKIILANQTFYQRSGIRPEDIVGKTLMEIFPAPVAEQRDVLIRQVLGTGRTLRLEVEGLYGWLDTTIFPIVSGQGQITHVMAYAHDITDRKKLESELRQSHATIDALLNASGDLIVLLDQEGKVLTANRTYCERVNRRPEEVIHLSLADLLPPPLAQSRMAILKQVFETGEIVQVEDVGVTGRFDSTVYPIFDSQQNVQFVAVFSHDITEKKKLEEQQRRDQRVMLAIANAPKDIFMLLDKAGTILMCNELMALSYDRPVEEMIGLCYWDLLPKPVSEFRRSVFEKVLRTGVAERVDDQGKFGLYDSFVIPIPDDHGEIIQVVIVARDITDRKQMELALKASEEKYRTLVETSPDGIAFQDINGNLLFVNQQFASLFGYDGPEEIYNLAINGADLLDEQDLTRRKEIMLDAWQNGNMRESSFAVHRKDGSCFQLEVNGSMVYDPDGKPTGIITICRDITDRTQMELALKASEEKYRSLVETSPDGIAYQDLAGKLLFVNQQFTQIFGFEGPEEIYKLGISDVDLLADPDILARSEEMRTEWQTGNMREAVFTVHRKDGSIFQVEVNGSLVFDPLGEPTGVMTVSRDITERKRIQDELVRAQENLERRVLERTAELEALNRQLQKEVFLRKAAEDRWKRHAVQSETLARVASRANAYLDIDAVMETICAEVIRGISYPICSISLYREGDDSLYIAGYASKVTVNFTSVPPVPRPLYEEYIRQFGSIITVPDAADYPATAYLTNAATPNIRTLVIMPFYYMGEMVGALNLASVGEIRLPNEDEIELMRAISDQAALSIMNARLFKRVSDSQARLKLLTERLVEVQEDERRRLARELHDEIGQMLTSLSLNLEIISRSVQAGEEKSGIQNELEITKRQIKLLLDEVRDLSLNLQPAMLDDLGLVPALLDHCQRFTSQTGIQVNLSHRGLEERVPPHIEIAAYRIVQEGLTNAARYADVDQVDVRLWATTKRLGIQIEDQGVGFDLQKIDNSYRSNGIAGMRERATNCGGNLEIDTGPGMGVCLTAEFPLSITNQGPVNQ